MSKIDKLVKETKSIGVFSKKYFAYLNEVLNNIDNKEINKLCNYFKKARKEKKNLFVIGNGGSATTATTMANDIGFDILKKTRTDLPFKVISLVDNNSVLTAISNDVGYENIFINQLKIHFKKGDYLIAISASGNSKNILKASKWVKSKGGKIIGFLGFNGGKLINLCDCKIHVKTNSGEYGPVEDAHLIINHVLAHWFQKKLES
tara:strand:- start:27637 stop:28251 length:615 start_codon:yes stop_codon:yes gene_type:complete